MIKNQKIKIKKILAFIQQQISFSKKNKFAAGFTLIETLVAITVLLLAITGPLEIASKSLFSAFYARDQITAYYLAQEGIEYIKNARDNTFLHDVFNGTDNTDWLYGLYSCIDSSDGSFTGCYFSATDPFDPSDLSSNPIKSCSSASGGICPVMDFDSNTGLWTQVDFGTNISKFTRKIEIIPQGNTTAIAPDGSGMEEAIIEVTVTWPAASFLGGEKTFVLHGSMMNWERK